MTIHNSTTCRAGVNGARCEMCEFAEEVDPESPYKTPGPENQPAGFLEPEAKNVSEAILAQSSPILAPTFEQEWRDAPKWATRTTERESAEYWFIRGQHAREVELLVGENSDLKEIARVVRERLGR